MYELNLKKISMSGFFHFLLLFCPFLSTYHNTQKKKRETSFKSKHENNWIASW